VKAQIKILSGALAGHTEVFSKPYIALGRHPDSDVQFDPERDLDVSARHAAIFPDGEDWYVRDVGSRNGTLVNGHKIATDTRLDDTDQIRLGPAGPTVEFRIVPGGTPDGVVARASGRGAVPDAVAAAPVAASAPPSAPRQTRGSHRELSTTQRIRIEVGRQTRKLRTAAYVLGGTLVIAAGIFFALSRQQATAREREIAAIQARTDSIVRSAEQTMRALQGQVQGLADALQRSQGEVEGLQSRLATAQRTGDQTGVDALKRQLADVTQVLQFQQAAAQIDYRMIADVNQRAVAMVYVEFGPDNVFTGTAFAVSPDGLMLTNRHVVAGSEGSRRYSRMGVQFADSDQFFPAELVAVSNQVDLALVKTNISGGVPAVRGLNARPDTLRQGDPVAIIGFPLGTDLPMSASSRNRTILKTTFSVGSVSKVLDDRIQIDGWGAEGASGSPIFDARGEVVAILFGGQAGSGGRVVYSVPSTYAIELLKSAN
jgi:S1-C subfamily serine protease